MACALCFKMTRFSRAPGDPFASVTPVITVAVPVYCMTFNLYRDHYLPVHTQLHLELKNSIKSTYPEIWSFFKINTVIITSRSSHERHANQVDSRDEGQKSANSLGSLSLFLHWLCHKCLGEGRLCSQIWMNFRKNSGGEETFPRQKKCWGILLLMVIWSQTCFFQPLH